MTSQWKRLGLAAGLSLSCAGATFLWYYSTEHSTNAQNETPLAQVAQVEDEVLKRPAARLLWQALSTGDNLYNGETIRTSSRGEITIQLEGNRHIKLEPDSLIVLQKSKGEISLDLMEGSLFVNAQNGEAPKDGAGLVLNSKNGKVDLTSASVSLSKGSNGALDLQVLGGKAKVKGADGKEKEIGEGKSSSLGLNGSFDSSSVTTLSPAPNKTLFIDPDAVDPVLFKWKGYPQNWDVHISAGPTKKSLVEIAKTAKPGETQVATKLPLGKHWYRMTAKDPATGKVMAESPIVRLEIQGRYPPALVYPGANAEVPMEKPSPIDVTFRWSRGDEIVKAQLEVSTDPNLRSLIYNKAFPSQSEAIVPQLKEGTYYTRMSSFYADSAKPTVGKIQKFVVQKPQPIKKDPVQVSWTLPENKLQQSYLNKPELDLSWKAMNRAEDVAGYRLRLENPEDQNAKPVTMDVEAGQIKAPVPKAGRYIASVEAVDKTGAVIGTSEPLTLATSELPLLKAPLLQPAEGDLKSRPDGKTELLWTESQGAKGYSLTIFDKSGKEVSKSKFDNNKASLKHLMPGEYTLQVHAVDAYGRNSEPSPKRNLIVPNSSGLRAPTLKKIKVN